MNPVVVISPARAEDVDLIAPLMADFNAEEHIPWRPQTMLPALRALIEAPDLGLALLARDADTGAALGYTLATFGYDVEFSGRDAFITELFVHERARGLGIGRQLLEAITAALRARDVKAAHLMVRPENERARALYAQQGFQLIPRLLMTRTL
jgi:ribosomal protein S18 acetylase RimI-like enzyme